MGTSNTTEVLRELGRRIQQYRLQQNVTVEDLARASGVGARTITRAEAGGNATLATVVKLLRALGRIEALDSFLPDALPSPVQLAAMQGRTRVRASKRHG